MAIDLVTKYQPYVDELFTAESKRDLLTNQDFSWDGAKTVKVYKISTAPMNDYWRTGALPEGDWSRYGSVASLDATTETMTLQQDRSFTFAIDAMDEDETAQQLAAASALARQQREVLIPELDSYIYAKLCTGAGTTATAKELTATDIYADILAAGEALDTALVPEAGRVLLVTPATYVLMKKSPDIVLDSDVGQEMRLKGVIGMLDGFSVVKVPAVRLPENFGFLLAHPSATVAPVKLKSFITHINPPGLNGSLVEGRVVYDAFILENKTKAIYYQPVTAAGG